MVLNCGETFQRPYETECSTAPVSHRQSLLPPNISTYPPLADIRRESWRPAFDVESVKSQSAAYLGSKPDHIPDLHTYSYKG